MCVCVFCFGKKKGGGGGEMQLISHKTWHYAMMQLFLIIAIIFFDDLHLSPENIDPAIK